MISESESCQRQLGDCTAMPNGDELRRIARSARTSASDDASPTEYVLAGWKAAMLAASPTPQQEAQEPAAYIHVPHHTVEGKVRPVVSFEKYQQDYADGIYSTRIPLYTAPQPAPAPLTRDQIREVFMANGFTVKEGQTDLKQYVYDAAYALLGTKPAPLSEDAKDAARWRTFIGLPYAIRAEWATNLSLVPVLTKWVDQAAIDAALAAQGENT